jgi:hypothetical protein
MFTSTPDALVEVSAMLRVLWVDGGNKILVTKVHEGEQSFKLTPADCRHLAAVLLKDLPEEQPAEKPAEKPTAAEQWQKLSDTHGPPPPIHNGRRNRREQ